MGEGERDGEGGGARDEEAVVETARGQVEEKGVGCDLVRARARARVRADETKRPRGG